ncbi:hypothetical protein B0H19DRAFT_1070793 [Mycena capillaripes]|nr:hypothetical protein B0H19DRAFT_1070793 [Mycena capillaripes]
MGAGGQASLRGASLARIYRGVNAARQRKQREASGKTEDAPYCRRLVLLRRLDHTAYATRVPPEGAESNNGTVDGTIGQGEIVLEQQRYRGKMSVTMSKNEGSTYMGANNECGTRMEAWSVITHKLCYMFVEKGEQGNIPRRTLRSLTTRQSHRCCQGGVIM